MKNLYGELLSSSPWEMGWLMERRMRFLSSVMRQCSVFATDWWNIFVFLLGWVGVVIEKSLLF